MPNDCPELPEIKNYIYGLLFMIEDLVYFNQKLFGHEIFFKSKSSISTNFFVKVLTGDS